MRAFVIFLVFSFAAQAQTMSSGTLKSYENFESKLVTPRNVDVWLPDGYSDKEKYSVLYMHDGQMLFDGTKTWNKQEWQVDEVANALITQDASRKFIVVGIWSISNIRHSDYFPQKPFEALPKKVQDSLYTLNREPGKQLFGAKVNSDNYLKFIVNELKPFIDKNFSVKTDKANTFIAGSSMGGLISMYAICEYPAVFGGAACLSTHWPGVMVSGAKNPVPKVFLDYLASHLPDPKEHKIYFDYGGQTLDAAYKPYQDEADEVMKIVGYTDANWSTRSFPELDHSEDSWAARLDIPLMFLLGK